MKILARLAVALIAAMPATFALAQALGENGARLHLVLDPDGRVRLSSSPLDGYAAPPLQQQPLPRLNPHQIAGSGPSLRLDVRGGADEGHELAPCLGHDLVRLAPFGACDPAGYGGLPGSVSGASVGMQLESGSGLLGLRLNYGLSWLDPSRPGAGHASGQADAPFAAMTSPSMTGTLLFPDQYPPALGPTPLRSERFGIAGFMPLGGSGLRLDLGYQHNRGLNQDFQPGLAPWLLSSQDSLSLGLSYGRFQGGLIGRQQRSLNPLQGGASESLDLGFSWRMPWWNAELEFGARNLMVRPVKPEGAERPLDQGDLRTPYLRYHQEL